MRGLTQRLESGEMDGLRGWRCQGLGRENRMRQWVTRDYSGSEDGLEERHAPVDHRLGESDRLGEESSARRSGDPERGLALQFNRFRNPYGAAREERKTTLLQRVGKLRNLCVDYHERNLLMAEKKSARTQVVLRGRESCWSWTGVLVFIGNMKLF